MEIEQLLNQLLSTENYKILIVPFILMIIDFMTGITHAWATGHLKSYKMRDGLNKKFAEVSMIVIGLVFKWAINVPKYIPVGIAVYVIIMELISICENLDKMGVPIPKPIRKALRNAEYKIQNGESSDKKEDDKNDPR